MRERGEKGEGRRDGGMEGERTKDFILTFSFNFCLCVVWNLIPVFIAERRPNRIRLIWNPRGCDTRPVPHPRHQPWRHPKMATSICTLYVSKTI